MTSPAQHRTDHLFSPAEHTAMRASLEAAALGVRGANPVVGAALLDANGRILHTGHHSGAGTLHAETDVLRKARETGTDLTDATMVITLEPCNHTGRTGPCTRAILDAGIKRVIFALHDGTEAARGGGQFLADRGVSVRHGLMAAQAADLNDRWFTAQAQNRPFVTLKIAQSLDGRVAAPDGTSQWITGPPAREAGHEIRARVDAILVGGGTARTDDPTLTARDAQGNPLSHQPLRAVMSRTPVAHDARVRRGVIASGDGAETTDGRFVWLNTHDPVEALSRLRALGAAHVLVEGGPTLSAAFLAADLVDELWFYQAPLILGDGKPSLASQHTQTLADAARWRSDPVAGPPVRTLGSDVAWHLRPAAVSASK
ncbi:bifunctional diaminohydroxyphosphoribosylaminopyrimidine deaminase/5-amino-6-(5-phosphoribosylamino)uracil reductase RibD [Kocuria atrinae]|uniref:Riboflavin biosynthesis protein RibD n=1 Tax=Kocuria atrinae TaxID=592377 RepID=A0ABP5JEQ0_9MICC